MKRIFEAIRRFISGEQFDYVRITLKTSPEVADRIKEVASVHGTSISETIRNALDVYHVLTAESLIAGQPIELLRPDKSVAILFLTEGEKERYAKKEEQR